ncbi:tetratricopeptide repeat protein [Fusibacter sp. JL298sf-3]
MDSKEITKLFDEKKYEDVLKMIRNEDSNHPWLEFIKGLVYEQEDFKGHSLLKSAKIYEQGISREDSVFQSYLFRAYQLLNMNQDDSRRKAVEVLKKGSLKHPESSGIARLLLQNTDDDDLETVFDMYIDLEQLKSLEYVLPTLIYRAFSSGITDIFVKLSDSDFILKYLIGEEFEISLMAAFALYDSNKLSDARSIFTHIITYAKNTEVKGLASLGRVLVSTKEDKVEKTISFIRKLPISFNIEPLYYNSHHNEFMIGFDEYIDILLGDVYNSVSENIEAVAILRGIKGDRKYQNGQKGFIADLKYALKHGVNNSDYYYTLSWSYYLDSKYYEAVKCGIEYIVNTEGEGRNPVLSLEDCDKDTLDKIEKYVLKNEGKFWRIKGKYFSEVLCLVIEALHKKKNYTRVVEIANMYKFEQLRDCACFEIAYAYRNNGQNDKAKNFYHHISKDLETSSSAVLNNLAYIYLEEKNFTKAVKLMEGAVEISNNDDEYVRKLVQINDDYKQYQDEMKDDLLAMEKLKIENVWVLKILMNFFSHMNDDGFIECPYRLLPAYMKLDTTKASDMIDSFIAKKYVKKASHSDHKINTNSTVYKVNKLVSDELERIFTEGEKLSNLIERFDNVNMSVFEKYNYSDELRASVQNIKDNKLRDMIERDVEENFLALITKSYKMALVLSGSIIESILLYSLKDQGITSYEFDSGNKKKRIQLKNMSLNELLIVGDKEKLFSHEILRHSDAVRGYRNLIHPSVEIRKSADAPIVTDYNAELAWKVTLKVVLEVL